MKSFKNILVATDTRLKKHPIIDEAVEIAKHNEAALKIVDVVPDLPWTVRLSLKDHEHVHELFCQEKEEKLAELADAARKRGVAVQTKVLTGKTSIALIREVLRSKHDLILRVAKGKDSRRKGFFGNTGMVLLRKCPCPVWLVTPEVDPRFTHVLGCVETNTDDPLDVELNSKVYDLARSISNYHQGRFSIVQAWSIFGEQILKGRIKPEDLAEIRQKDHDVAAEKLESFVNQHHKSGDVENVHLIKGEAPDVISHFIRENDVDLVVMGTVARAGVAGIVMGNTAEQILNRIECSVLALKPSDFVCPITLDSQT